MFHSKMHFAIIAGVSAALGSVFGKLSGTTDILNSFTESLISLNEEHKKNVIYTLQMVCFVLMIICNASVWSFYVKALNSSNSSLPATVISTATNYITSGLIGVLVFEEVTSLIWWAGTGLVVLGLAIIAKHSGQNNEKQKTN